MTTTLDIRDARILDGIIFRVALFEHGACQRDLWVRCERSPQGGYEATFYRNETDAISFGDRISGIYAHDIPLYLVALKEVARIHEAYLNHEDPFEGTSLKGT